MTTEYSINEPNHRVLDERSEHEDEAGGHPDVDGLGERDGRHVAEVDRALGGDGQHGQDTEGDSSRHGLQIDPEGHPRQQDDQDARQERRQDVRTQTSFQVDVRPQTWKRSLTNFYVTYSL